MTDELIGDDKGVNTEPPVTRHMQTWEVTKESRKCGPSYTSVSSQVDGVHQSNGATQTQHDDKTEQHPVDTKHGSHDTKGKFIVTDEYLFSLGLTPAGSYSGKSGVT